MSYALKNNERGFTLIEVVIGLAISLILMGVAVSIFNVQRKSYSLQEQVTEMQQYVRSAMDMIVRDARMAGYNPAGIAYSGISVAQTGTMTIQADYDGSGIISGTETITYAYDAANNQIDRNAGGGAQPFAENIEALTFSYLDSSGVATTTVSSIRQIRITITGRTDKPDLSNRYSYGTLTSRVTPENLSY
ncbi:MAG: prepilin-type N-terminal cleavage/methylation domain-containing protein [Candidatus Brocadiaceae bacterium]|nr:prepilin-type N-terminal cleavage/methylation domain-containing protein [Candidatus Brocadiaceae bacterium]